MGKRNKLLAWLLTLVMALNVFGYNALAVSAEPQQAHEDLDVSLASEDELTTWAAGITDADQLAAKKAVWMDSSALVDDRVDALLSAMTLEEKAAQMVQPEQNEASGGASPEDVKRYGIGSVLSGGGSAPSTGNTAQDWADRVNSYKQAALESRLGIPLIYGVDAVHGHNNVDDAVIFPHNIGFGAADDVVLAKKVGQAAAEEIRGTGIQWTFAPTLGVVYSERWGRYYESFGEDPELVGRMGAALVEGFQGTTAQGDSMGTSSVAATAKHYIGEGQTKNGVNQGNVEMSEEEFEKLLSSVSGNNIIKPYEDAIAAGAKTVMASYNSINGVKMHGNKRLLTEILKGARTEANPLGLDFKGFVVSDYNGLDQIENGTYEKYMTDSQRDIYTARVAASIDAGVDMFMEPYDWNNFINATAKNVNEGIVSKERIDDAVGRILRVKFEMGLFEEEVANANEQALLANIGSDEHRAIAKEAVEKSLVVLKNEEFGTEGKTALQTLQDAESIIVAGYKGNDIGAQCGGWTISWQGGLDADNGSGGKKVTAGTTIYEGFKNTAKEGTVVSYNARGQLSGQDAAVIVVGETPYAESNGDKTEGELVLPANDINVIKTAIKSKGDTPLILVLMTGRPLAIADYVNDFDAIVEAWLPGSEGDGVAEVMLNDAKDFSGTMPVTWPWYPADLANKLTDSSKVLFPVGTGLKKDGSSIKADGQTTIPGTKPDAPEEEQQIEIKKYKSGIDIDAYDGKLEGEFCNPTSGDASSYNIETGTENADGQKIGYAVWDKKEWGNAKWTVYFRQAGTYQVSVHMQVTSAAMFDFSIGPDQSKDDLGGKRLFTTPTASVDYQDVVIGTYMIDTPGLYYIKMMDVNNTDWSSGNLAAKLDYITLNCTDTTGEKEVGEDAGSSEDPKDATSKDSEGSLIDDGAVEVYMTSTEKSGDMSWYKYPTDMAHQMEQMDSLPLTAVDEQNMTTITIDLEKEYQEILGFGTSLEEASVNNLSQLTPAVRDKFLRMLVDPDQAGMTLFRVTIGTSDFTSKPFYTYYDAKELTAENAIDNGDGTLSPDWYNTTGKGFSIQKDIDYNVIETIKKVQELAEEYGVQDEVRFFASSWTPPGWMKKETSASKSYKNNDLLIKGGALDDARIGDVAKYYTRYLEEYAKRGIDIYAITLQNEPMLEIDYPSCAMSGEQEGKLAVAIKKEVAASTVLNADQKQVKLWAFDHNPGDAYSYVEKILSIEGANDALDGVAFHDYGGSLTEMQRVLDNLLNQGTRKDQTVNLTERSVWGTKGANSIITYLRNSGISYNSWVTMLDSNIGVHQWVGTPDPTMFARAAGSDNDYWAMPEYYITGQFSRFIRPGYVRVDSNLGSQDTVTNVVFKDKETNKLVAVVVNQTSSKQNFKFVCEGTQVIGALPAQNVATYVWSLPEKIVADPQKGFGADEASKVTEGVTSGDDNGSYISFAGEDDKADYIVNVPKAGLNYLDVTVKNDAETGDDYRVQVYQGDNLIGSGVAIKADGGKNVIRIPISVEKAGMQQITISTKNSAIKLYDLKITGAKDIIRLPGKILASEYTAFAGENNTSGGRISADGKIDYTGWWTKYTYKVNAPKAGNYAFVMSAAKEGDQSNTGFWVNTVNGDESHSILTRGCGSDMFGGDNGFNHSNSWTDFALTTGEIYLSEGENTLRIDTASDLNIAWLSIGSFVDVEADAITEGKEDGKMVQIDVTGGTVSGNSVSVNGLPEGVDFDADVDGNTVTITLSGNRTVDYDQDKSVTVSIPVAQEGDASVLINEAGFTIEAVNDAESLVKPDDISLVALNEMVTVPVKIEGGTFNEANVGNIIVTGNALSNYSVTGKKYVDPQTIEITLKYTRRAYRAATLNIEVPASAYDDSTGNGALTTSVSVEAESALPDALEFTDGNVTLTEDKAYASDGKFNSNVAEGNYVDYFINVPADGNYTVIYSFKSLSGDGTSFDNAWDMNRGVPGTIGTNSYKQVSIPGLWTSDEIKIRQNVELSAGKQTFELKAKKGGYEVTSVEIAERKATVISTDKDTQIAATTYVDQQNNAVVIGQNVEYTNANTALDYPINVAHGGTYEVKANYAIESNSGVSFKFSTITDGEEKELATIKVPQTGAWGTYKDSDTAEVILERGETILRLTVLGDGSNLKAITITPKAVMTEEEETAQVKGELATALSEAETLKKDDYTAESWTAFEKALAEAKSVLGDVNASYDDVKAANEALAEAQSTLVKADKPVIVPSDPDQPGQGGSQSGGKGGQDGQSGSGEKQVKPSVKLNATSIPLQVGKSTTALKITQKTPSNDKVVKWTSSNKKIVTVTKKGKIKAKKAGTAYVTVTMKSGAKAKCKVKVQKKKVTTKKLTIDAKKVSVKVKKKVQLNVARNPITATEKIKWTTSNKKVATVTGKGKVTGKKAGKATITAKTTNGKKIKIKVTVTK